MIRLDDQDLKILLTLQREGRITKVKLAEAVNLSPSPCWERLKRLEDLGVISGYHAHINLEMLPLRVSREMPLRTSSLSKVLWMSLQIRGAGSAMAGS